MENGMEKLIPDEEAVQEQASLDPMAAETPAEAPADSGKDVENTSPSPETTENNDTPTADNPHPVAAEVEKVIGELKVLREQMSKMRDEFQKGAILSDSIRTPAQVSADEALSELIRPKYDNK